MLLFTAIGVPFLSLSWPALTTSSSGLRTVQHRDLVAAGVAERDEALLRGEGRLTVGVLAPL